MLNQMKTETKLCQVIFYINDYYYRSLIPIIILSLKILVYIYAYVYITTEKWWGNFLIFTGSFGSRRRHIVNEIFAQLSYNLHPISKYTIVE